MLSTQLSDTLIKLMAAWLLLFGAALWARREGLKLSKRMLIASLRGLVQLLALAFVLHWVFDIQSHMAQGLIVIGFCVLAGHTSAGHHPGKKHAWLAASTGLICACLATLPWLAVSGAINANARTLIPLGSMVAANGMNAISIMFERQSGGDAGDSMRTAMIPTMDTLRVAGLVHMPGIFVGMTLAGAAPMAAASAQLVVLYMIVASSFTACMVSFLMMNHFGKGKTCA
ncbi:MAG: ABC transporter permease [Mariprofundaceae bacterium]|nr:ABC transporter permease [Mariprofundaceae bacterium]